MAAASTLLDSACMGVIVVVYFGLAPVRAYQVSDGMQLALTPSRYGVDIIDT